MELLIRISFWIVPFLVCLRASYLPQKDANIDEMRNYVTCPPDSKFYAPTNIKVECITTALDCVMRELSGTVMHECEDPDGNVDPAVEFFEIELRNKALSDSEECACEQWPQTTFNRFLDRVEFLLQLQKSDRAK